MTAGFVVVIVYRTTVNYHRYLRYIWVAAIVISSPNRSSWKARMSIAPSRFAAVFPVVLSKMNVGSILDDKWRAVRACAEVGCVNSESIRWWSTAITPHANHTFHKWTSKDSRENKLKNELISPKDDLNHFLEAFFDRENLITKLGFEKFLKF